MVASVLLAPEIAYGGGGGGVPSVTLALSIALLLLQLWLCARFTRNVHAFCRGDEGGEWRIETGVRHGPARKRLLLRPLEVVSTPILPRRLEKQTRYFTLRFAPHARRWQLVLWARQLALFAAAVTSKAVRGFVPDAGDAATYAVSGAAILILVVAWWHHRRSQPYAYRFQNAMESWLFASNVLLLVLACVYSAITQAEEEAKAARLVCEVALLATLVGGILAAACFVYRDARATRKAIRQIDFRVQRRFVGRVRGHAREGLDLARGNLRVEALGVALLHFIYRDVHKNF